MFDINNVDRPVEMFIFDIYIAIWYRSRYSLVNYL